MMLPVSVMKVIPTATQPTNEIAVSNALMLNVDKNPWVVSAKPAMVAAATMRMPSTRWRARKPLPRSLLPNAISVMPLPDA
jgi:hypothetical protein